MHEPGWGVGDKGAWGLSQQRGDWQGEEASLAGTGDEGRPVEVAQTIE